MPEFLSLESIIRKVESDLEKDCPRKSASSSSRPNLDQSLDHIEVVDIDYTHVEEKALLKSLDKHIMPYTCAVVFSAFLCRTCISNMHVMGILRDLECTEYELDIAITAFYLAYILFVWASPFMWSRPKLFIPPIIIACGTVCSLTSIIDTGTELIVMRLLLGIFQALICPGIYYYMSQFYTIYDLALRIPIMLMFCPLASLVSSLISYPIIEHPINAVEPWRMLILVCGLPSILVGLFGPFTLCTDPAHCQYLTYRFRKITTVRLLNQGGCTVVGGAASTMTIDSNSELPFLTLRMLVPCVLVFVFSIAYTSFWISVPKLVHELKWSTMKAQALSVPLYVLPALIVMLMGYLTYQYRRRAYVIALCSVLAAIGYIAMASPNVFVGGRYCGMFIAPIGTLSAYCVASCWMDHNRGHKGWWRWSHLFLEYADSAGSIVGVWIYSSHNQSVGNWVLIALLLFAAITTMLYRGYLWRHSDPSHRFEL